eukprot:354001-Chlamydomonas_euryale.AAC.4
MAGRGVTGKLWGNFSIVRLAVTSGTCRCGLGRGCEPSPGKMFDKAACCIFSLTVWRGFPVNVHPSSWPSTLYAGPSLTRGPPHPHACYMRNHR